MQLPALREDDHLKEALPDDLLDRLVSATAAVPDFQFILAIPGLYGPDSPLPRAYHQEVAYQQNERPSGYVPLQNFLDIFNNRLYWLYYQSWKKYRLHLQLSEQSQNSALRTLYSFSGLASMLDKDAREDSNESVFDGMPNGRFALTEANRCV